ncbi:MAG: glutathione-disulfide reductase [Pseudomonadota bacterium]
MKTKHFDLIVIGAGSGGIATAEKAASYGAKVAIIEKQQAGGTCVNLGCVPKKIMWYAGDLSDSFHYASDFGFQLAAPQFNFATLVRHRQQFTQSLSERLKKKLLKHKITFLQGSAAFVDAHTVEVNNQHFSATHIVIATGCESKKPTIKGVEYGITSDGFFGLRAVPKKIAIVGNGYIATELASILNQLGSQVKILIRKNKILSHFDSMISETLTDILLSKGIQLLYKHDTAEIHQHQGKLLVRCKNKKTITDLDAVLFAIGRSPRTQHLHLAAANIKTNTDGFIKTNKWETTNIPHIYAIGDVTGKKLLTPVAIAAGRKLAARLFGKEKKSYLDYQNIPTVVFTHPPIGSVGLTHEQAIDKYGRQKLTIYQTEFSSLFSAFAAKKFPSKMRLITLKKTGKIIGCHIIGPNADEMLQGFAVAIKMGATKADFDKVVAIHPTSAEELVTLKASNIIKA